MGKLAIPEHILNKPGRLTPPEYEIMKRHAPIGADILSVIGFPYPVVPIVRHHHENWDGTGYPEGLAGEQIPIGARILAVVDCYDALTSDRPYRRKLESSDALQILAERRGSMYDPRVVDAFFAAHAGDPAVAAPPAPEPPVAARVREVPPGADAAVSRLPDSAFVFFVHDESSHALVAVHDTGAGQHGVRIPVGERLSGWVAATGQAIVNSDARLDFDVDTQRDVPWRSALAVPVRSGGRVAAVLTFYAAEVNAFSESHRTIVESLAHCLGTGQAWAIPAMGVEASQSQ